MKKKTITIAAVGVLLLGGAAALLTSRSAPADPARHMTVYRHPTCNCCGNWVRYAKDHGFTTEVNETSRIGRIKAQYQIPSDLSSCHTTLIDGYIVEGHVPIGAVERLLSERPNIVGITVPGMPMGSPGMEGPNPERYEVLAFDTDGSSYTFAEY